MPSRKLTDRCPGCGCKNHLRARFCNQCGGKLDEDRATRDADGRVKLHADIAHPINSACREIIQSAVLKAFHARRTSKQPGYVCTYDDYDSDYDEAPASFGQVIGEMSGPGARLRTHGRTVRTAPRPEQNTHSRSPPPPRPAATGRDDKRCEGSAPASCKSIATNPACRVGNHSARGARPTGLAPRVSISAPATHFFFPLLTSSRLTKHAALAWRCVFRFGTVIEGELAMSHRPIAIGLLLCEQIIVDERTKNVTPVNCFTLRTAETFPWTSPPFTVLAWLTDGEGEVQLEIIIEDINSLEVVYRTSSRMRLLPLCSSSGYRCDCVRLPSRGLKPIESCCWPMARSLPSGS